jgi:membrane-bound lytic murein transglycosylase D
MMKYFGVLPLLLLLVFGCASNSKKEYKPLLGYRSFGEEAEFNQGSRVQQHIVESSLTTCDGCMLGSSNHSTFSSPMKTYELKGAEHLNLKNVHFDIPVVWNEPVQKWVKYFSGRGRDYFVRYASRGGRYAPVLSKILADNGIPRDLIFLAMAESGFQNHAKSWAKAVGPWQFMSFTGKRYGLDIDWYTDERRDPLKASAAAAQYLKDLYEMFGTWELATASYNAGEGKISRAISRYGTRDFWKLTRNRYIKPETKNYVPKIMALAIIGKNLESFGFNDINFDQPLDYEEILVKGNSDLYEIAKVVGLEFEELSRYNPELIRWTTPPSEEFYPVRVPVGKAEAWVSYADKDGVVAKNYKIHEPRKMTSLTSIAKHYQLPVDVLKDLNPDLENTVPGGKIVNLPFRADHDVRDMMYADLYDKKSRKYRHRRAYSRNIASIKGGHTIRNPKQFYVVKKGDTLWHIARKTGVPMSTIIKSNAKIVKRRSVSPGDKLAIR